MQDKNDLAKKIGSQLKAIRLEAGLTLKKLADETRLSSALISRIEHGKVMPSVPTLQTLAVSLKVEIGQFFRDEDQRLYVVSPKGSRRSVHSRKGYESIELLAEGVENAFMEAAIVTAQGICKETDFKLITHDGQEFMYVLEGKLEVTLGGKKFVMKRGDAAYWYGKIPHKGVSVSKKPARTLNVHLIPGKTVGSFE
ncbi:MAG: XRE family transcriptional regulator [Thermodesulfobacteriota bacterium]